MEEFTEYEGQLNSHRRPHGQGKMRWKTNGDTYIGSFHSGFPHGFGEMTYKTLNNFYIGEFSKGKKHGIGHMLLFSGDLICGRFENDHLEGYSIIYTSKGDYFEGLVSKGRKNGQGLLRYSNGEIYIGNFLDNARHGIGKLTMSDGIQYFYGAWQYNNFTGRGKCCKFQENSSILSVYEGEFVNGKINGEGVMTDSLGICYRGQFENGKMHGVGELLLPNGGRYVGEFLFNEFKKGKAEQPDRTVAYGNFYGLSPDGIKVKINYVDGNEYEGGVKQGRMSGFGTLKAKSGIKTIGTFENGTLSGLAQTLFPDGTEKISTFASGKETELALSTPDSSVNKKTKFNTFD